MSQDDAGDGAAGRSVSGIDVIAAIPGIAIPGIAISGQASAGATAPVNSSTATTIMRIKEARPAIA